MYTHVFLYNLFVHLYQNILDMHFHNCNFVIDTAFFIYVQAKLISMITIKRLYIVVLITSCYELRLNREYQNRCLHIEATFVEWCVSDKIMSGLPVIQEKGNELLKNTHLFF